jgi:RNA-binding protein
VLAQLGGRVNYRGMQLSERQRKYLRGLAHALEPVIRVGQHGVTEAVVAETSRALADHELIKVKIRGAERADRDAAFETLAARTCCALVHRIGHVGVFYKARGDKPGIVIPAA